jgi:hypothetical protein
MLFPIYFGDGLYGDTYFTVMDADSDLNLVMGGTASISSVQDVPLVSFYNSTSDDVQWTKYISGGSSFTNIKQV